MNSSATRSLVITPEFIVDREGTYPLLVQGRAPNKAFLGVVTLAWGVRLVALINLATPFFHPSVFLSWIDAWDPFEVNPSRRFLIILTSLLLFSLASGLERGKRTAWLMTIGALALASLLHLGHAMLWPHLLLNFGIIGFLIHQHAHFVVRSDQWSVRAALIGCPVMLVTLLLLGTLHLQMLREKVGGDYSLVGCLRTVGGMVLAQDNPPAKIQSPDVTQLFSGLRIGGIFIILSGVLLTLRPVFERRLPCAENRIRVTTLIDRHGCDSPDAYALLGDKSHFITLDGKAVVPYVVSGHIAVALGEPIAPPELKAEAIMAFARFCRRQDWEPIFHQVSQQLVPAFHQAGFSLFKAGEEAWIRPDNFHLKGGEFQNLRTACNRAKREGIRHVFYPAGGMDPTLEDSLTDISWSWLDRKKGQEMTFDMGAFSVDELRRHGAHIAQDASGKPLAFATWRPFAQGRGRTLDLMRSLPEARNVMDFLLTESIRHFHQEGISRISLGTAPLANTTEDMSRLSPEEKAVKFLFENLNRIYGYKSLFEFKRKFRPDWEGRYIAWRRGIHLPQVGLALVRVHAPQGLLKFFLR